MAKPLSHSLLSGCADVDGRTITSESVRDFRDSDVVEFGLAVQFDQIFFAGRG